MNIKKMGVLISALLLTATTTACGNEITSVIQAQAEAGLKENTMNYIDLGTFAIDEQVNITAGGSYTLNGSLEDGQILIDAGDESVELIFDNISINCDNGVAIYVADADCVTIMLEEGSVNTIDCTGRYDDEKIDAAIFAKSDLILEGAGTLKVSAEETDAIYSKGEITVNDGNYEISTADGAGEVKSSIGLEKDFAARDFSNRKNKDNVNGDGTDSNSDDEKLARKELENGDIPNELMPRGDRKDFINKRDRKNLGGGAFGQAGEQLPPGQGEQQPPELGGQAGEQLPPGQGEQQPSELGGQAGEQLPPGQGGQPGEQLPPEPDEQLPPGQGGQLGEQSFNDGIAQTTQSDEEDRSLKGIKAKKGITINAGSFYFDTEDDSIHSNGFLTVTGGDMTILTGDDALHADGDLQIQAGNIDIQQSYEGIEGMNITINEGNISIISSDDGINAASSADAFDNIISSDDGINAASSADTSDSMSSANCRIEINGGSISINAEGDGIDSNGDIEINGGFIVVDGTANGNNAAIDYGDRSTFIINGGELLALGNSSMAGNADENSSQTVFLAGLDDFANGNVSISDSSGEVLISYDAKKEYNCIMYSSSKLKVGESYTIAASGSATTIEMDEKVSGSSNGMAKGGFMSHQKI